MKEILKNLYRYEIRMRKSLNNSMHGDFKSIFKGSGLEYEDVRTYQYGDDVRIIDWNVSAKGHGTFVKTFREEKEQRIFFIVDVSASQQIGNKGNKKLDLVKQLCGTLAYSASKESCQIGLLAFSDQKEIYIKPQKGIKHFMLIVSRLFRLQNKSIKTNISKAIHFGLQLLKRKAVVFLISDFIDEGFEKPLKALARKHDLVVLHIADLQEFKPVGLGLIPIIGAEDGKIHWKNTSSRSYKKHANQFFSEKRQQVAQICKRHQADYQYIQTNEDFIPYLVRLFQKRNQSQKSNKS